MNAVSDSEINFTEENAGGSDSDTISDDSPEYYEPISSVAFDDGDDSSDQNSDNDHEPIFHRLSNGDARCVENEIDSLDLSDKEEDEEEKEDERMRESIQRAFQEDESRRRAPLTPENATRVREAMRGISFQGLAPDWASQVPEDSWINQLASIRQPPSSIAS